MQKIGSKGTIVRIDKEVYIEEYVDVSVDIGVEEFYDSMSEADIEEMKVLLCYKNINFSTPLDGEIIKDLVYNLVFGDPYYLNILIEELRKYKVIKELK